MAHGSCFMRITQERYRPSIFFGTWQIPDIFILLHTSIVQVGVSDPVKKWGEITPVSRVKFHPSETHLFSAISRGPMSLHL